MENKEARYLWVVVIVVILLIILYVIFGYNKGGSDTGNERGDTSETTAPNRSDGLTDEQRTKIIEETTAPTASAIGAFSAQKASEETSAPLN